MTTTHPSPAGRRVALRRVGRRRAARHLLALAAVALVAATASGCASDDPNTRAGTQGLPSTQTKVRAHDWKLDAAGSTPALPAATQLTLAFGEGTVVGRAPCNTVRGPYRLEGASLDLGPLAGTKISCGPVRDRLEARVLRALAEVDRAVVDKTDDERLTLSGPGVDLHFRAVDVAQQLEGTWLVTNLRWGDALRSPVAGTDPTLTFDGDQLRLDAGCNAIATSWHLDGNVLIVDPVRQTQKACPEPPGAADQEAALVDAIQSGATVDVGATTLSLLDGEGGIALVASRQGRR